MLWRELAIVLCNFVPLQITVDEALAKLRAVRPWVCPNDGFVVRGPTSLHSAVHDRAHAHTACTHRWMPTAVLKNTRHACRLCFAATKMIRESQDCEPYGQRHTRQHARTRRRGYALGTGG